VGPRLGAQLWVEAHIRRCWSNDVPAMLVRRGHDMAGVVLLKINRIDDGCTVLAPATDLDGNRTWFHASGEPWIPEADVDVYIARRLESDPDLWVIEIEDREGRHFLDEPVE
jgi:hypothetical protein